MQGLSRSRICHGLVALALAMALSAATTAGAREATPVAYTPPAGIADLKGELTVDGSSTVYPITDEAALRFREIAPGVDISVAFSGTGGGFAKFCAGETDLQNASRPIEADEIAACAAAGIAYYAFEVAFDGVTVVVNPANSVVSCLTVEQLRRLWTPDDPANTWRDLDPAWPDEEIELYGPGPASGTFDYFTAAIVGTEGLSRADYVPSENDLDLVMGVEDSENGLAYFGFAYYEQQLGKLRAVAIDAGNGCVSPSRETIADGSYAPLSRPLLVYVNAQSLQRPETQEFLRYYLANAGEIAASVLAVPDAPETYSLQREKLEGAIAGSLAPDGPGS